MKFDSNRLTENSVLSSRLSNGNENEIKNHLPEIKNGSF